MDSPVYFNFFEEKSIINILNLNGFNTTKILKKTYLDLRHKTFNFLFKAFIGKYQGSTIYVIAELNKI
jgi:hypothetical protein